MRVLEKACLSLTQLLISVDGVPEGFRTWTHLYDVHDNGTTISLPGINEIWGPGAEIVVTSADRRWDGDQTRTIRNVSIATSRSATSLTQLQLNNPLEGNPTTLIQSDDFAVEVALVSRNILIQGETGGGGAHFWVFQTPHVRQLVRGIQVQNFGQQGTLGRYPIHFHLCRDVSGSIVAQNTVSRSNQRCVVVHGTDNLLVEENVAFDTKGHCFLVEDVS